MQHGHNIIPPPMDAIGPESVISPDFSCNVGANALENVSGIITAEYVGSNVTQRAELKDVRRMTMS